MAEMQGTYGGRDLGRQAQPGHGEQHLAAVFWLPIKITIAVICGTAFNRLGYDAFCLI